MSLSQDNVLAGMFARRLYFLCLVAQGSPTLCNPMDYRLPSSSVHGDSPGENTGVGCHALFQGIFRIFTSWLFRIYKPIPYSYPWESPSRVICFLFRRRVRSV